MSPANDIQKQPDKASDAPQPGGRRISFRKLLPFLIGAVVLAFGIYWFKFQSTPVTAHAVATGEVRSEVMGTGTLEARIETTISPRIQERLAEVLVDQGDYVKSGQLLARLDDAETKQQVAIAEASLAAARTTVERARPQESGARPTIWDKNLNINIFEDFEKEHFCDLVRRLAGFTGLDVVTFCVMGNHFHLLIEQPDKSTLPALTKAELLRRARFLYDSNTIKDLEQKFQRAEDVSNQLLGSGS